LWGLYLSKWLSNLITALVILAATSALGAVLKGPIDEWVNENRLKAQVQLAPWFAKPTLAAARQSGKDVPSSDREILDELLENLSKISPSGANDDFGVARVNVENSSSKKVTDINFRLDSPYGEQEFIIIDSDGKASELSKSNRIIIPDMNPGDRITVYLWGNYSKYLFSDRFKTYSSEGKFRVAFEWPEAKEFEYQSGIARFLDDYATDIAIWTSILLMFLFLIMNHVSGEYIKVLMKYPAFYERESERYTQDPKKFSPDVSHIDVDKPPPISAKTREEEVEVEG
jgi:hypothetical protein